MISRIRYFATGMALLFILTNCSVSPPQNPPLEFTAIVKPTLTSVPTVTKIPTATSTPEVKTVVLDESTSPDGEWTSMVSVTTQAENKSLLFRVSNSSINQEWVVEQVNLNELKTPMPGFMYPYAFKWSQDENYLYYSYLPTFNDGCFGYFKPGGFDLKRLDLSNGNVVTIRDGWATWMAISPDEKKLGYIDTFGGNVSILDIENSKDQTFTLPPITNELDMITDTSDLYWSPDGKSLIYAHYVGACDLIIPYSYIIQLYPENGQQRILVDHSEQGYIPVEWKLQNKILLKNIDNKTWWFNPNTKELTPADQ